MAEEKPFRVLLDLSELSLNVSKYVWMNVSPRELNNIADFKNAVLKKLNFDRRDIKLFVHDGLLPEDEKIIILRENDTVKIQYDDPSNEVSYSSSINEFNSSKVLYSGKRKRDFSDVAEANNESFHKPHKKKKKHKRSYSTSASEDKACTSNSTEPFIPEVHIDESETDNIPVISIDNHSKESENTYNIPNAECEVEPLDTTKEIFVSSGSNCKKRKRKRHKKRKDVPVTTESLVPSNSLSSAMQVKSEESPFVDKYSSIRKHIRFTSPTPSFDATNGETAEVVDLDSYVSKFKSRNNLNASENIYKTPESPANHTVLSHKNSTPSSQTFLKQNSWSVSPMQNERSIETEQPSVLGYNETLEVKKEAKLSYSDYPTLNCLPSVGIHLAFKTLELDENYSPAVTPYKEGIIRYVNQSTEALEIELVEAEIKPGRAGKFENLARDEDPSDQIIKTVTLNWSNLIDPRCITED